MKDTLYTGISSPDKSWIHTPLIAIVPLEDNSTLRTMVSQLADNDILLFTSRHGVSAWHEAMTDEGCSWRGCAIVSIGSTTTRTLQQLGAWDVLKTETDNSYGVIDFFASHFTPKDHHRRIIIPRSDLALNVITEGLAKLGFDNVCPVTAYHNRMPEDARKVDLTGIGRIVFSSPSTIDNFIKLYGFLPDDIQLCTRGKITENHLKEIVSKINHHKK